MGQPQPKSLPSCSGPARQEPEPNLHGKAPPTIGSHLPQPRLLASWQRPHPPQPRLRPVQSETGPAPFPNGQTVVQPLRNRASWAAASCRCSLVPVAMEDALLGAMTGPEDELGAELFGSERAFADGLALSPAGGAADRDELPVLADAYLGATEPGEPLLRALSPPPGAEVPAALLGDFPGLPELRSSDDAAPPPAYSVHVLSSLLPGARGPALLPLSAGVRVIPVSAGRGRRRAASPRA